MADQPKLGQQHVKNMLTKGVAELQSISFWEGSNAAQPLDKPPERSPFEQAVEQSRDHQAVPEMQQEQTQEHDRGHER